ncbi:hypothetical protein V5O48_017809 [Marasmius crinis-equi]|uniref:Uncharacterized protein n=1 Tax=Marasmius crinis-equi TaxID=585013 RepID=A0ABR3EN40_9AGAR
MEHLTIQDISQLSVSPHTAISSLFSFIRISRFLKQEIQMYHKDLSPNDAPNCLPDHVKQFLSASLELEMEDIENAWISLKDVIWNDVEHSLNDGEKEKFERYGKDESEKKADATTTPPIFRK